MKLYSLNMLEVITDRGPVKRYINGRRVSQTLWDLAQCHSQVKECFSTTGKNGKWYHRHVNRCAINFGE